MAKNSEHDILLGIFQNNVDENDLITLIAGVGVQRIPISRTVLMANSKYFTALLGSNFEEANENEFILDGIDGPTLKAIVDFCYTGRIDLTEENVSKYLAIASGVELRLLEQKCSRFFADKLNINNALTTLAIADKFNNHVLRQKAFDFICELFDKLPPSRIDGMDNRLLEDILKSDAVHAEEWLIFKRLMWWCRKNENVRRQHMTDLLKLIRLPLIPSQYLNSRTMQMTYKEFEILESLNVECKRRIASPTSNADIRRRRSIYCLYIGEGECEGEAGALLYGVKVERFVSALNKFESVREIDLGHRMHFEATLHGNKLYIFGGVIDGVVQKSVSVFDLTSGEERVLPEMTTERAHFASILVGKFIYVFSGSVSNNGWYDRYLTSCERFDLEVETWETLKPMSVYASEAAVAVQNGDIYVVGGYKYYNCYKYDLCRDVGLFDPQNGGWKTLSPMQDGRARFSICSSNGYLYAMGYESTIERYDPLTNRWSEIGSCESWRSISNSVVFNDNIYVIKRNGDFGKLKIDENGRCSLTPFAKSAFSGNGFSRHLLFCNY